eukprot:1114265-Prymnesium_polylepis.2
MRSARSCATDARALRFPMDCTREFAESLCGMRLRIWDRGIGWPTRAALASGTTHGLPTAAGQLWAMAIVPARDGCLEINPIPTKA